MCVCGLTADDDLSVVGLDVVEVVRHGVKVSLLFAVLGLTRDTGRGRGQLRGPFHEGRGHLRKGDMAALPTRLAPTPIKFDQHCIIS